MRLGLLSLSDSLWTIRIRPVTHITHIAVARILVSSASFRDGRGATARESSEPMSFGTRRASSLLLLALLLALLGVRSQTMTSSGEVSLGRCAKNS